MKFSKRSQDILSTCHPDLQRVVSRALCLQVIDFSVIEGHRSAQRQQELFTQGRTQLDGVKKRSKHNADPSEAVDLLPWPYTVNGVNVWDDKLRFHMLAGVMFSAASLESVRLRWGGDWDGDGNNADSNFHDLPHFEILL